MSSRALRRLQKEQLLAPDENGFVEETVEKKPAKQLNPFDLLNEGGEEEEEEEEEEIEKELEKPVEIKKESVKAETRSSKPSKKKKKNKEKGKRKGSEDLNMHELDKAIQQINSKNKNNKEEYNENTEAHRRLLSVNVRLLDAEAEMKRMFGSHVVNNENRGHGRILKKSKFTTPKPEWPPYKRNGLSMELVENRNGVSEYAFRHSETYQHSQVEFLSAVETLNPEELVLLVRKYPYHVDTLLQLSEVAKQSGDWVSAGDFIERALYACEKALHPQFSLSSGSVRLAFKRSENRSFFLVIFRHIQFLARRGCWRTAFEFNKLLFALDPIQDPLGSLLTLDHLALAARDYNFVVQMHEDWKTDGSLYPANLANMPNFAFSSAYAQFKLNKPTSIQQAVDKFPLTHQLLLEKLDKPTENKSSSQVFLSALQSIYAEQSFELFKEPEVLSWLGKQKCTAAASFSAKDLKCKANGELPQSLARFLLLTDNQRLLSLVPSHYTNQSYRVYDPLPPQDSETMYDVDNLMASRSRSRQMPGMDAMGMLGQILRAGNAGINPEAVGTVRDLLFSLDRARARDQLPGTFPVDESQEGDEEAIENEVVDDFGDISDSELELQRALEETFERQ